MRLAPIFSLILLAGAASAQPAAQTPKPATAAKPAPPRPALEPGLYAVIQTSMGVITALLFEKESPITVRNFVDLATGRKVWTDPKTGQRVKRPLYNGLIWHRVIPGFMIQGGDPMGTGMGGTDAIPDEFDRSLHFDRPGRLGMANAGPGTGSSQFFITDVPTPHLDGLHTIFGQVVAGQEVVGKIARVPRDDTNRPRTPVRIVRVTIKRQAAAGPAATKPKPAAGKPKPAPASKPKPVRRKAESLT
ncbi:MAG: peptidylprolyl isomerase [Acidobacteria bacterium]|nr:peptidylprolyl isomerase [Acidobacteriota bacterium]